MKLIAGLGNPGPKYSLTRHNAGFIILDLIAEQSGVIWRTDAKSGALLGEFSFEAQKIYLLKTKRKRKITSKGLNGF